MLTLLTLLNSNLSFLNPFLIQLKHKKCFIYLISGAQEQLIRSDLFPADNRYLKQMKRVNFGKTNELLSANWGQMCTFFDRGPTIVRLWSDHGPTLVRPWSDHDPTMVRPWSDSGLAEMRIEFGAKWFLNQVKSSSRSKVITILSFKMVSETVNINKNQYEY